MQMLGILGSIMSLAGSFMGRQKSSPPPPPPAPPPAPVPEPVKAPEQAADLEVAKRRSVQRQKDAEQQALLTLNEGDSTQQPDPNAKKTILGS